MNTTYQRASAIDMDSLVNSHDSPFVVIDKNYCILAVNKAYEQAYGVAARDAVGRMCYQVSHGNDQPCDSESEICPLGEVLESGQPCVCAHIHYDADHRMRQVKISAYPLQGRDGELYIGECIDELSASINCRTGCERMVGNTPAFLACIEQLNVAARSDATVLLQGETGTGKELAAEYIHNKSSRSDQPFQIVDSTVLTENLFESEVFGHERGAYTGSNGGKKGLFELASGGTVFLDEIGDLPMSHQAKLLRVLETGQFRHVGGTTILKSDVRIICATNRRLWASVQTGHFREDLYYRIACLNIRLPNLLERLDDIPVLARSLIESINRSMRSSYRLTDDAYERLKMYEYPGNVRELRNILFIAATHSHDREISATLVDEIINNMPQHDELRPGDSTVGETCCMTPAIRPVVSDRDKAKAPASLKAIEAQHIKALLVRYGGNRKRVAAALNVSERTIYRKLRQLGLN